MRIPKNIPSINPCVNLKITLLTFGGMVVYSSLICLSTSDGNIMTQLGMV